MGVAALLPLAAFVLAERRVAGVRTVLSLEAPRGGADLVRAASLAAVVLVLGLAAAQPAWASRSTERVRTDAQVLFVVDTSQSMAASSGAKGATRFERAITTAADLRSAIAETPAGIATLTDRVLPTLLPVPDPAAFTATLRHALAINTPPPRELNPRATSLAALAAIPSSSYFAPSAKRRVIVVLTDGESVPYDAAAVARALEAKPPVSLLTMRLWRRNEAIYNRAGKADPNYRPDPASKTMLETLAEATDGQTFDEGSTAEAAAALRSLLGRGTTRSIGRTQTTHPLAPYVALVALVPLALVFRRRGKLL